MPSPKETLAFLQGLKVGAVLPLQSIAPGLTPTKVLATVVEAETKYWEFDLSLFGVFIGKTYVEKLPSGAFDVGDL